jgi:hypothetical protein
MMEEITITHKSGTLQDQSVHMWLARGDYLEGWNDDKVRNRMVIYDPFDFARVERTLNPLNVIWKC